MTSFWKLDVTHAGAPVRQRLRDRLPRFFDPFPEWSWLDHHFESRLPQRLDRLVVPDVQHRRPPLLRPAASSSASPAKSSPPRPSRSSARRSPQSIPSGDSADTNRKRSAASHRSRPRRCDSSPASRRLAVQRPDVHAMLHRRDLRRHQLRRVLDQVAPRRIERPLVHPHQRRLEVPRRRRQSCPPPIRSPRLMSISSSSVSVTDIGAHASSKSPSNVEIDFTRDCPPRRHHRDFVARLARRPTRSAPRTRGSPRSGRTTRCTAKRNGAARRRDRRSAPSPGAPAAPARDTTACSSLRLDHVVALQRAEIGMKLTCGASSCDRNSPNSVRICSKTS